VDPQAAVWALAGGALIGLAAAALLVMTGRIAGVSGILGGLVRQAPGAPAADRRWRLAFFIGLLVGGAALRLVHPEAFGAALPRSTLTLIVAGLLVGFGSRLGGGCTSGHGVCGVGRFSKRSIVATLVFMATGALTVFVVRRFFGGSL
jgi:uncharacterized protein